MAECRVSPAWPGFFGRLFTDLGGPLMLLGPAVRTRPTNCERHARIHYQAWRRSHVNHWQCKALLVLTCSWWLLHDIPYPYNANAVKHLLWDQCGSMARRHNCLGKAPRRYACSPGCPSLAWLPRRLWHSHAELRGANCDRCLSERDILELAPNRRLPGTACQGSSWGPFMDGTKGRLIY